MLRFMDSCVVGVNVCGRSPIKFVAPISVISEMIIRAQVCAFGECDDRICLMVNLISHSWIECSRLLISRFDGVSRIVGAAIIRITMGSPIIVGVIKGVNRFSFISVLKGFLFCIFFGFCC